MFDPMQEFLNGVGDAQASVSGNYIKKGSYRWTIERVTLNKTRKGVCFIPELRVKRAEKTDPNAEPNSVGETVSCVWNTQKSASFGNIKAFILAAMGRDEATTSKEEVQKYTAAMISKEQPFRGVDIDGHTVDKTIEGKDNPDNRGKLITVPVFKHVPGQTETSVAKNRAELDAGAPATQAQSAPPAAAAQQSGFNLGALLGK